MGKQRTILLALLCFALSACGKSPIKVGVSMVLTGINSEIGVSGRNAVELAAEEINREGGVLGRRIELLVRNDGSESEQALAVDEELREKGVVAIIGHMISASGKRAAEVAAEKEFPIISPTISSSEYAGKDDYLFRMVGDSRYQGIALARYAHQALNARKIGSIVDALNISYSSSVESSFRVEFEAVGGTVLSAAAFPHDDLKALSALIDGFIGKRCDAIISVLGPKDSATLCALLEKKNSSFPVLAGTWAMTPDLIQLGGRSADRMRIAGLVDTSAITPKYQKFFNAYKERFGSEPTFASVYSYEALRYLAAALEKARSFRGRDIKEALLSLGTFEGLQDSFKLDSFGDADRAYSIFAVRDGRFVSLK